MKKHESRLVPISQLSISEFPHVMTFGRHFVVEMGKKVGRSSETKFFLRQEEIKAT